MQPQNLFRFVALRPPTPSRRVTRVHGDEAAIKFVAERLAAAPVGSRDEWRSIAYRVGADIIRSGDYVRAEEWGPELIARTSHAREFLQELADAAVAPKRAAFIRAARDLIQGGVPGLEVSARVPDGALVSLQRTLWISFFATFLNPHESVGDNAHLVTWIVMLYLMESDSDADLKARADRLAFTRPAVPVEFLSLPKVPVREPPEDDPPSRPPGKVKDLKEQIALLQALARRLQAILERRIIERKEKGDKQEKEARARGDEPIRVPPPPQMDFGGRIERKENAVGGRSLVGVEVGLDWQLRLADLDVPDDAFDELRAAGVLPELTLIPDAIEAVARRTASLMAELAELERPTQLARLGRGMVELRAGVLEIAPEVVR